MFAVYTFIVAFVLLGVFIVFRMWEQKRGIRIWAGMREDVDEQVVEAYRSAITGSIPQKYRIRFLAFLRNAIHGLVLLLVATLRAVERPLTRISYRMRMSASNTKKKEVSPFLKTIAPKKDVEQNTEEGGAKNSNSR